MKPLIGVLGLFVIGGSLLMTNLLPWRIVSRDKMREMDNQISSLQNELYAAKASASPTGAWMWDPHYRTSLEKTTVVGRPEPAKNRDWGN